MTDFTLTPFWICPEPFIQIWLSILRFEPKNERIKRLVLPSTLIRDFLRE